MRKLWTFAIFFLPFVLFAQVNNAQTVRDDLLDVDSRKSEITGEASAELFSMNLNDANVSLLIAGYWKGALLGNWGLSRSKFGWGVAPVNTPVLFTQEADMTLSLRIKDRWFVEAGFQEDYDVNTFRAGYEGQNGDFVRYAGIGNTGLDFPVFPYLDLGGDSSSSLGFYGAFGSGALTFHSLFRYDAAAREERVFVGGRERTYAVLPVSNLLRGISFVLPDSYIAEAPVVLFEDADGPLYGDGGTRWRMALPGEAAVSARDGLIELAETPKLKVAVYYPGGYLMGDYDSQGTFLGDVQAFFTNADLKTYLHCGGEVGKPALVQISGFYALVIYEKGTFSPFERQSRYAAPVSGAVSAALVDSATKEVETGWDLYRLDESPVGAPPLYAAETDVSVYKRDIYVLSRTGDQDPRSPLSRWPLGRNTAGNPWLLSLYLSGQPDSGNDVELRWTAYSSEAGYTLGRDVLPGSIRVLRGGISDPYWAFDEGSGLVRLQTPAQLNEVIRISYLRRSLDRRNGSIAAGLGTVYDSGGAFSAKGALGVRWNIDEGGFSEQGAASAGMAGASVNLAWNYADFKADISVGAGLEQPDTTGIYRAAGMEGHEAVFDIPESSFLSNAPAKTVLLTDLTVEKRARLVYRNYRDTNIAGISSLKPIEANVPVESAFDGPYPAWDDRFGAKVMAAEFELDGAVKSWTGFQSPLADTAIAQSGTAFVPFRLYETAGDIHVFAQFGPLTPKDSGVSENGLLIVERELGVDGRITFSSEERRKLQGATFMRIIITSNGAARGRVLIAPPVFFGAAFSPLASDGNAVLDLDPMPVSAVETIDTELARKYPDIIKRLHPEGAKQRVLRIGGTADAQLEPGQSAGAGGRVGVLPFENYKTLSFFVRIPAAASSTRLDFYAARGKASYGRSEETAIEAHINAAALLSRGADSWVKVELRYAGEDQGVFIAGERDRSAAFAYRAGALRKNSAQANDEDGTNDDAYLMIFLSPENGQGASEELSFSVDEILLEESETAYYINSGIRLKWNHGGVLLGAGSLTVLENGNFETGLESAARGNPAHGSQAFFTGVVNRSRAGITLFGFKLSGVLSFSLQQSGENSVNWWTAGHGVSKDAGPLSLSEEFFLDPSDGLWNHSAGARLSAPFNLYFNGASRFQRSRNARTWRVGAEKTNIAGSPFSLSLNTDWGWTENAGRGAEYRDWTAEFTNYGEVWRQSWERILPDNGAEADLRTMNAKFESRYAGVPVGAGFTLHASAGTSKPAKRTQNSLRAGLDFPWTAGSFGGNFRIERKYERALSAVYHDAGGDLDELKTSFAAAVPIALEIPLFALFDSEYPEKVSHSLGEGAAGGAAGDLYAATVRLPQSEGITALWIPRQIEARVDRNIIQRLDTVQDILGAGVGAQFAAVNIFSAGSGGGTAGFYQNDEIRHSISAAYARPKYDKAAWQIRAEQSLLFYGFHGAELRVGDIVSVLNTGWTTGFNVEWTAPNNKSLLGVLYERVMRRFVTAPQSPALQGLAQSAYDRLRKEKLTIEIDRAGATRRASISARHESIVRISGRLGLSAFAALIFAGDENQETFLIKLETGTTLQVNF